MAHHLRITTLLILLLWGNGFVFAQSKRILRPDSAIGSVGSFDVGGLAATYLPDQPIAVVGTVNTYDTAFVVTRHTYLALADRDASPLSLHLFQDSITNSVAPHAYAAAVDGYGHVYHALGAHGKQVVLCTDLQGQVRWTRQGHHHELIGVEVLDTAVYLLAQDEGPASGHDLSIFRTDTAGRAYQGMMYGTLGEDLPAAMTATAQHLLLSGRVWTGTQFGSLLIEVDRALDQVWGWRYVLPGRNIEARALCPAADGSGYLVAGRAAHPTSDSAFVLKVDTAGQPLWARLIGLDSARVLDLAAMAPVAGGYLLGGKYMGPEYNRPWLIHIAPDGAVAWARTYGPLDRKVEESVRGILPLGLGDTVAVAMNRQVDVNFVYDQHATLMRIAVSDGALDCDSVLAHGSRPVDVIIDDSTMALPYVAAANARFYPQASAMNAQGQCGVMIAQTPALASNMVLQAVSPTWADLRVRVELPQAGTLELYTSLGQWLGRKDLPAGLHSLTWAAPVGAPGLYVLVLRSEGRQPVAQRVVVLR